MLIFPLHTELCPYLRDIALIGAGFVFGDGFQTVIVTVLRHNTTVILSIQVERLFDGLDLVVGDVHHVADVLGGDHGRGAVLQHLQPVVGVPPELIK